MKRIIRSTKYVIINRVLPSFVLAVLAIMAGWQVVSAARAGAVITVTTTSDVIADDGQCSLREAVIAANSDNFYHDCPAGSGSDTIKFSSSLPSPGFFILAKTGANEDLSATGDLGYHSS